MNYWEFLIQKEGDRTWLPLEAQQVEVLAGRYRIAAHTNRTDAPLAIRLSPLAAEALPADSEVGVRKTDESGLVLVLSYVHLAPGSWLLECSSLSSTNGLTGEDWHHSIQFQVHAHTESGRERWPASRAQSNGSNGGSNGSNHGLDTAASVLMGSIENADSQQINKDLPLIQAQAALTAQRQSAGEPVPDSPFNSADLAYQVSLRQRAYLAQHNQPTTIIGKVNAHKVERSSEAAPEEASELWIRLQNPQTAQVIMAAHRPLSLARLPADFKVQIQLPAEVSTRIILGEVSLQSAATPDVPAQLLASTAFTITAGVAHLLAAIAHQKTDDFEADSSLLESTEPLAENSASADPSSSLLLDPTKKDTAPAVGVILPPQLNQENQLAPFALSQPELPTLPKPHTAAPSPSGPSGTPHPIVSQPAQFIGTSILDDDLEADEVSAVLENIGLSSLELDNSSDSAPRLADPEAIQPLEIGQGLLGTQPDSSAEKDTGPSPQNLSQPPTQKRQSPTRQANVDFQSLQLKNHFWQRLSTLTHESHKAAAETAEGMRAAGVSRERSDPSSDQLDLDLEDEIVIFDELPAAPGQYPTQESVADAAPAKPLVEADRQPYPLARQPQPANEAPPEMALPVISVPIGDLVAGEFITVAVRTRPSAYRPFIKLWMVDRQSRSLVMEPQRLTNLRPDALGDLQATAKLQIPMDCLDVQIAAIAIDIATQQESGKAIVNRHVVPAGQSSPLRINL